ncbi:unnamed protein product [Mytilus coruscus]|uniref:Uncharacterized protein n=1 Tax=Mytilus coruscus TaxID=42192 RepID=A0A6J8A0L8_MYTCO|nr:unnamed protein product [Mytilus coruscus]
MAWKILLQSVLIGFFTKDISGNYDINICPEHLSRTDYLKTFGERCYRYENIELDWPTARSDKVIWDNWASGHPNSNFGCGNLRRDDGGKFAEQKSTMNEGELSGVIVASVLGAIALLTLLSFCFFRTRNYEFLTGSQSINSDPNEGTACQTKLSNVSVTVKESGHYSEISKHKMGDKLIVSLPNYDNNEYEECNIATRKVGVSDSPQYLNESADSKTVYYSVSENEAGCNAMNEQLETSKNQYDECGNGEGSVNSPIYYIDMTGAEEIGESTVDLYA